MLRVKHGAFPKGGNLSENQRHPLQAAAFWNFQGNEWGKKGPWTHWTSSPAHHLTLKLSAAYIRIFLSATMEHKASTQPSLNPASLTCTRAVPCARLNVLLPASLTPPLPVPLLWRRLPPRRVVWEINFHYLLCRLHLRSFHVAFKVFSVHETRATVLVRAAVDMCALFFYLQENPRVIKFGA